MRNLDKNSAMKHTLTLLTVLLLTSLSGVHAAGDSKPNILVILADDLGETKNRAAAMPEKVAEMKALLEKLITDGRSTSGAVQKNDVEVKRYPAETDAAPKKMAKARK